MLRSKLEKVLSDIATAANKADEASRKLEEAESSNWPENKVQRLATEVERLANRENNMHAELRLLLSEMKAQRESAPEPLAGVSVRHHS